MQKRKVFTVKKLVLALALAGYAASSAYAVLTLPTGTIRGTAPVLSAASNSATHAIDFAHTAQTAGKLTSGDTLTLSYQYTDAEGDKDSSNAHVAWFFTKGGVETPIAEGNVNSLAATTAAGATGTSTLTLPSAAIGADSIGVRITEFSVSGDPVEGQLIEVLDIANGGGGTGPFPPTGPVVAGNDVTPGIYLSTDTTFSTNLVGTATKLDVGKVYVFKLWDNANIGLPAGDMTGTVSYNWRLVGQSATDSKSAPATGFVTSVSNGNFTVPVNGHADGTTLTGSVDGAQGFQLAVDYN